MQVEDDNHYWDNGGQRIRKAPAGSVEIVLPDAKRQMSTTSPSSAMEISAMPQHVPVMPSADDVLVQVSSFIANFWTASPMHENELLMFLLATQHAHSFVLISLFSYNIIQMIRQSGATTYAEVVEFCRSTGIPLSRMLSLDLMRQLPATIKRDWNDSLRGDSGHNKGL